MTMRLIKELVAKGKVKENTHLPIEESKMMSVDELAIAMIDDDITHLITKPNNKGKNIVYGFVMDDTLYQSTDPKYHLSNRIPELMQH